MLDVTAIQRHRRDKTCQLQLSSHAKGEDRIKHRRVIYEFPSLFSARTKKKPRKYRLNQRKFRSQNKKNMENALEGKRKFLFMNPQAGAAGWKKTSLLCVNDGKVLSFRHFHFNKFLNMKEKYFEKSFSSADNFFLFT